MLAAEFCVDSSALVAIFNGEAEGDDLRLVLARANWAIGWPTILEIRIWLVRNRPPEVNKLLEPITNESSVGHIAFDGELEAIAIDAFTRFGKGRHKAKLNFGDCMSYAVARHLKLPLLFKGGDFGKTDIEIHPASVILA